MAEVILRMEKSDGSFVAYSLDSDVLGSRVGQMTPTALGMLPGILSPVIDGLLFGLRHGPVQRLLKGANMPPLQKFEEAYNTAYTRDAEARGVKPDLSMAKNAATLDALGRVIFQTLHTKSLDPVTQQPTALDIRASDLSAAGEGLVRRKPEWDAPAPVEEAVYESEKVYGISAAEGAITAPPG